VKQDLLLAATFSILLMCSGCENNFSATGDYPKQLVVYGVLSNRSDSQYVRVYTTYNLTGLAPAEQATDTGVRGARVKMTDDSTTYGFTETAIPRDDTSRYSSSIIGYVDFPCRLRPGTKYSLSIISNQGNATATVFVPGNGYVFNFTPATLEAPRLSKENIPVTIGLSAGAQGYLIRLFINFDGWSGQYWEHRRLEIPSLGDSLMTPGKYGYPTLTRRPAYSSFNFDFAHDAYLGVLKQQIEGHYGKSFRLTSATFILTQVESNLYNYYNLANGFRDPFSIRMDQPDYTNIVGGVGVFGAMVEDSVVVNLY
jgi:hypothetical protein